MILQKRLLAFIFFISSYSYTEPVKEAVHPFSTIGNKHIDAFTKEKKEEKNQKKSFFSKLTGLDDPDFTINKIKDYDRYNLLYNEILTKKTISPTNAVITPIAWKDLELLCGDHSKSTTMLSKIDRTITGFGHAYFSYMLTNPTDSIVTLKKRQAITRTLIKETKLANDIEKQLQEIKEKESAFLYFWKSEENKTNDILLKNLYWRGVFKGINESPAAQELQTQGGHLTNFILPLFLPAVLAFDIFFVKSPFGFQHFFLSAYAGLIGKVSIDEQVRYTNILNYLHEQTNSAASIIRALNNFEKTFKKHPSFKNLENYETITNFSKENKVLSKKLKKLIKLLKTRTFTGRQTIFSRKGRVRTAYYLIKEIKAELIPALYAIGEIDTYLSTTKIYQEFKDEKVKFSFVSYDLADKAHIVMKNMWNPFVPINKVVTNSITLGQNMPQNIIITGPNAGGKSTFLKGLTTSILMAQTFGIAPVKDLAFTPFAKINTYMNITDDTAGGNSLFKSEVLRAQELLETVKSLDSKKFSLSIMDEMFSGTSPREGEAASYGVAKRLGTIDNSILLLASHFPKLKNLESRTPNFKNYQVRVVRHDNGSFSYPFKLEEGAADQNVAIDILKQQGFDSSILDDANELLNELD
ncbi:MAG: DNA mismatch repair protein MutS [Alteromonas naphthalenivorans]|jgi:DNA mismatch repair protein MutS